MIFSASSVVLVSYIFVAFLRGVGLLSVYKVISAAIEIYCVHEILYLFVPTYGVEVTSFAATILFTIFIWFRNKRSNSGIRFATSVWCIPVLGPIISTLFYGHISDWDVSAVTNMESLLDYKSKFNDDISGLDTSNVTTMKCMFRGASAFSKLPIQLQAEVVHNFSQISDLTQIDTFLAIFYPELQSQWH